MISIEHFGGTEECIDEECLVRVLSARYGSSANEFWLTREKPYPRLAVLIVGDKAAVYYYPYEGHPGFASIADALPGTLTSTVFYTNTPIEEIEISDDAIISIEKAVAAAKDFLKNETLPASVRWLEL